MGRKKKFSWDSLSDRELQLIRDNNGGYRGGAEILSEMFGKRVALSTFFDEVKRRGLIDEPAKPQEPELPTAEEALAEQCRKLTTELKRYEKRDRLEQRIVDAMREEIKGIELAPFPPNGSPDVSGDGGGDEYILLLSDGHYSEVVKRQETGGMEEYGPAIHDDRMVNLYNQLAIKQDKRATPISRLNVFYLGDCLSGDIHEELQMTNAMPTMKAIKKWAGHTVGWHQMLESLFEEQYIAGVSGNHPRLTKKPYNKQAWNSGDWMAYNIVEMMLEDKPGYYFDLPESNFHDVILSGGWRFLLMHGQGIKSYGSNGPEVAVKNRVTKLQEQYMFAGKPIDYVTLGHWHRSSALTLTGARAFINGALKGIDEYGFNNFGNGTQAEQVLLTLNPEVGVTDISYLNLLPKTPNRLKVLS